MAAATFPQFFQPWFRMFSGGHMNRIMNTPLSSYQEAITALAGGAQLNSPAITAKYNRVGTVATSGDSVQLPVAACGAEYLVRNDGANPLQVFGAYGSSDTIDGTAGATGISVTNGKGMLFFCTVLGRWSTIKGA